MLGLHADQFAVGVWGLSYVDCSSRLDRPYTFIVSCRAHFGSEPGNDLGARRPIFPDTISAGNRGRIAVPGMNP